MAALTGLIAPPPPLPTALRDPRADDPATAHDTPPALEMSTMLDAAHLFVASVRHRTR